MNHSLYLTSHPGRGDHLEGDQRGEVGSPGAGLAASSKRGEPRRNPEEEERRRDMKLWLWLLIVLALGCLGSLALVSHLLMQR